MTARLDVLLVEDDPDDAMLLGDALAEAAPFASLKVAPDGLAALDALRGKSGAAGEARPALVLLDWRLPGKSGLEVLREIRRDPALKSLPVLVLTTSRSERDVADAYEAGANCFLTKPNGLAAVSALVASLADFWLVRARLPGVTQPSPE